MENIFKYSKQKADINSVSIGNILYNYIQYIMHISFHLFDTYKKSIVAFESKIEINYFFIH